jgi:hypothetical protein
LETARIAISEKLPIYIIFTMRSDFISQCVAFKGLPEFIGFSQFFIPRLKRNELQQVIEEPALLSAGKLSPRLVEVLINELHDGFDQLPVLQHTLNSLWRIADNGNVEIDLIHLAKLSGIDTKFLDETDLINFENWFKNIENYRKDFFENQSLANVLNSHANELYLTAYNYFQNNIDWAEKNISEEDAKFIIKTTFQCLTKIDEGRAVRNRMTLAEITRLIDKPHITTDIVCGVMNIFRLPSNTFIRPFIDENDIATQYLSIESVWDITHESLIRNWELLKKWEEEEYQNLANFRDYNTQLNRWLDSDKSKAFLLAVGNLTHFEEWNKKSNLNSYWIAKYDNSDVSQKERVENSHELANLAKTFLLESRRNIDNIENAKKRQRRMAFISAIFVIIVLLGFTFWALNEKSKAEEQKKIAIEETKKAEEAKILADENAYAAKVASLQSDSARTVAEQMRLIADQKTYLAIIESQNALREKNRADNQLLISEELRKNAEEQKNNAELQKNKAEQQKTIAELATESANKLSQLAIAQALTFKAVQNYTDKQINLLLAYHAYRINKENEGDEQDASIFQALLFAMQNSGESFLVTGSNGQLSSIAINSNTVKRITTAGIYSEYDLETSKIAVTKTIKADIPINQSFIFNDKILISLEDKSLLFWDISTDEQLKLKGHSDFVRAAVYSKNNNLLISGSRDKTLIVWDLNLKRNKDIKTLEVDSKITHIILGIDETEIFVACSNGEIFKWNLLSYEKTVLTNSSLIISALTISKDGKYLLAGTSAGALKIIYLKENNKVNEIEISKSKIDAISISPDSKLFAVSSSNKIVNIYKLNDVEAKTLVIDDFTKKITTLYFYSNTELFTLSEDNYLSKWLTDNELLARELFSKLNRNFTQEEWNYYIGSDVDYNELNIK